jgi:hypothetical protein
MLVLHATAVNGWHLQMFSEKQQLRYEGVSTVWLMEMVSG